MPTSLIPAEDIIVETLKNYRKNIRLYGEFAAWFTVLSVVVWAFGRVMLAIPDKTLRFFTYAMFSLPMGIIFLILTAALIDLTAKLLQKKRAETRSSLFQGLHFLIPFIWVSFLTGFVSILGLVLLVVPGIIFYFWYRFSAYELIVNDVRGLAALGASRRAVAGRWWAVFFRVAIPAVFFYLAARLALAIVYLVFGALLGNPALFFNAAASAAVLPNLQSLLSDILPKIVQALALPLFFAADLILWLDMKRD